MIYAEDTDSSKSQKQFLMFVQQAKFLQIQEQAAQCDKLNETEEVHDFGGKN